MGKVIKTEIHNGYKIVLVEEYSRISSGYMDKDGWYRELYGLIKYMGRWTVGSSTCLPSDLNKASAYIAALNMLWSHWENNRETLD